MLSCEDPLGGDEAHGDLVLAEGASLVAVELHVDLNSLGDVAGGVEDGGILSGISPLSHKWRIPASQMSFMMKVLNKDDCCKVLGEAGTVKKVIKDLIVENIQVRAEENDLFCKDFRKFITQDMLKLVRMPKILGILIKLRSRELEDLLKSFKSLLELSHKWRIPASQMSFMMKVLNKDDCCKVFGGGGAGTVKKMIKDLIVEIIQVRAEEKDLFCKDFRKFITQNMEESSDPKSRRRVALQFFIRMLGKGSARVLKL
ncbi:unnamed protein product [Eruca vesicaria subsp. sativa]|uniref:Exportin-2 central domain-containing protein n=1 Tax=Eruca vesicaria subsp. sativa TaxID=29727 RepID=A0ABC8KDA6_ERUVS|nr:unnamed protein product [Eruca vesicaria subsp. sativa]